MCLFQQLAVFIHFTDLLDCMVGDTELGNTLIVAECIRIGCRDIGSRRQHIFNDSTLRQTAGIIDISRTAFGCRIEICGYKIDVVYFLRLTPITRADFQLRYADRLTEADRIEMMIRIIAEAYLIARPDIAVRQSNCFAGFIRYGNAHEDLILRGFFRSHKADA